MSDEATYKSTIEEVEKTDGNQFLQVITMQNHMPYHDWYKNNDFKAESTTDTPLEDDEKESIETYQKGVALTDEATADFLDKLDAIDKPITVVFYGDHLPGIYSSASEDDNNSLALHLTDYFIWSNKASSSQGNEIDNADYSSPNFFVAQAAEHMNAKVSPYLAFLTQMHEKISAMEPPVVNNIQGWDRIPEGQNIYLDADGNPQKTFRTGEEMVLDLHYECKKKVTDAVFGFGIFRSDGLWCYGTNTRIDHKDNFDIERDGSYRVDLKELMLIPAEYWVDVTIEYGEGNPVDYYKEALRFEVVSKVSAVGVLRIPHEWTLNI